MSEATKFQPMTATEPARNVPPLFVGTWLRNIMRGYTPTPPSNGDEGAVTLSASDYACYLWPEVGAGRMRDAFVQGAEFGHKVALFASKEREARARAALEGVRPVNVMDGKTLVHIEDDETRDPLFSIPIKHRAYADLLCEVTRPDFLAALKEPRP